MKTVPTSFSRNVLERMFPNKRDFEMFYARYEELKISGGSRGRRNFAPTAEDCRWYGLVSNYAKTEGHLNEAIRLANIDIDYLGFRSETTFRKQNIVLTLLARYGRMAFLEKKGARV